MCKLSRQIRNLTMFVHTALMLGCCFAPGIVHSPCYNRNKDIQDQIPIQTLSAVNNLFRNSVLAIQNFRRPEAPQASTSSSSSVQQYTSNGLGAYSGSYNRPSPSYSGAFYNGISNDAGFGSYSSSYYRPPRKYHYQSAAAMRGDLPVKDDGSSYRI